MLHLIVHRLPAPLHRQLLRLAHGLRIRWWRVRKPRLSGCRVLAFDAAGRLLLVRHSYGSGAWMPPGGGLERGETVLAGAIRELREETGCNLQCAAEVALTVEDLHGAANRVHFVTGLTADLPVADGREIIEAVFFAPETLPAFMPVRFRDGLPTWITAAKAAHRADPAPRPAPPPAPTG